MLLNSVVTAPTSLFLRIENAPPHRRKARFCAPAPITTAEALWASGLSGEDLEEAFDALSLIEQERYLARWRYMGGGSAGHYLI